MKRITEKQLQNRVDYLNELTGSPMEPYSRLPDGTLKANIGNFLIDGAYDGWKLVRMNNKSGGVEVIIEGYRPRRELLQLLEVYIMGIDFKGKIK